jgi:hypothetical protein
MLNCMPDQVDVNPKIFMYRLVSHARNGFPVDLRIKLFTTALMVVNQLYVGI